jgi:hypothetical protein
LLVVTAVKALLLVVVQVVLLPLFHQITETQIMARVALAVKVALDILMAAQAVLVALVQQVVLVSFMFTTHRV